MHRLAALLLAAATCLAPLRAQSSAGPIDLPPESAAALREGWVRLRGPATLDAPAAGVIVGFRSGGQIVPRGTAFEQATKDNLRNLLASQGILVVADEIVADALAGANRALARRTSDDVAARTAELVAEYCRAGIMLVVELTHDADPNMVRRNFRALDTRTVPARFLASETYFPRPLDPGTQASTQGQWLDSIRRGATDMGIKLGAALAAIEPYVPVYRVQALDLQRREHERWIRAIRQAAHPGLEVVRAPAELGRTTADVTPIWIRFNGDWYDLADVLAETATGATGRSMVTVYESGGLDFIVTLQETQAPWSRFVAEDAAAPAERIGPLFHPDRRPTVALLYGEDLDAPRAALLDERDPLPPLTLADEVAARTLGRYFAASGFEVKDTAEVRRQLADEIARANLGKNLSGMREALRRSSATDLLVLVRIERASGSLALTVLDARGTQIAFADYPDSRVRLYEDFIDVRKPDDLMRYVGGHLLQQLHQHATDNTSRSIQVVLKNTRNAQQAAEVMAAFRTLEGVKSCTDLRIDQPVARFNVNATTDATTLVLRAADLAGKKQLGAKGIVEFANEQQIVFNILPAWLSEHDDAVEAPKPVVVAPAPVAPTAPAAPAPAAPLPAPASPPELAQPTPPPAAPAPAGHPDSDLIEAMRRARDSIWKVGFDMPDGRFVAVGTAWTVGPNLLATNAHVLGVPEKAHDAGGALVDLATKFRSLSGTRAVARNGANLERKIDLDLSGARVHPAYARFEELFEGAFPISPYDVAIIPTRQAAGAPLRLANADELRALQPLQPVGYSGYPAENRALGGLAQQSIAGTISSLSTIFLQESDDATKRLIIHFPLTASGGASGSPMFGPRGTIVGLLSAVDHAFLDQIERDEKGEPVRNQRGDLVVARSRKRVPIGFSYGQRVDMLVELMENRVNLAAIEQGWRRDLPGAVERLVGRPRN